MLQLDRFNHDGHKISGTSIDFTSEIDIGDIFMAKIQTKSLYELWGIVCHSGVSLESGQLYCYTKRSTGLMLSDEQVKVVTRAKSMGV